MNMYYKVQYEWNICQFYDWKGLFSGSLSPNGVPSSKDTVSKEDAKVNYCSLISVNGNFTCKIELTT